MQLIPSAARKKAASKNGYTLIEMALVLIVVGIAFAVFGTLYKINVKQRAIKDTHLAISTASAAIADFRAIHSRYPCPASLTYRRGDAQYGHEYNMPNGCADTSIAVGSCVNGTCVQQGTATIVDPVTKAVTHPVLRVRVGALPFRELGLREEEALDGYGNRLQYVVTEPMAVQASFATSSGAIEVVDSQNVSVLNPPGSAQFLIMSLGPDGDGAYNIFGQLQNPCVTNSSMEANNCDNARTQAVYRNMPRSTSGGVNQFDDFVNFYALGEVSPWQMAEDGTHNIYYKNLAAGADVGFRTAGPDQKGQADGNMRARVQLQASEFCDSLHPANCTKARDIGGDLSTPNAGGIACGVDPVTGKQLFMQKIEGGVPTCISQQTMGCEDGTIMTGVQPDGTAICDKPPPKPCPSQTVDLCSGSYLIQGKDNGQTSTVNAGDNLKVKFKCVDGSWVSQSSSGTCECKTTTQTKSQACDTGFSGQIVMTRTQQCPSGTWTGYVQTSNTCVCVGGTQKSTADCPDNYTGSISQSQTFICDSSTSGHWGPVTVTGNTCKCTPKTITQNLSCPSGWTGKIVQSATLDCPSGQYSPWVETSNTCKCNAGQKRQQVVNCPAGQIGEITQEQTLQCPSGQYTPWAEVSNTCQPQPPVVCHWRTSSTGSTASSPAGAELGDTCGSCSATGPCHQTLGGGSYRNYGGCSCE